MTVIGGVPVKIGFTGTRAGMTWQQKDMMGGLLKQTRLSEFHHGNAKGADKEARDLVRIYSGLTVTIFNHDAGSNPLARNKDIVNATDWLFATPRLMTEEVRSGTWHTIRYARKQGKRIVIVWPDGSMKIEEGKNT